MGHSNKSLHLTIASVTTPIAPSLDSSVKTISFANLSTSPHRIDVDVTAAKSVAERFPPRTARLTIGCINPVLHQGSVINDFDRHRNV